MKIQQVIELSVIYFDNDMIELRIVGSNGRFAGTAELFIGHDELRKLADDLRGFPTTVADHREFELGTFDDKFAGGGARLVFRCTDSSGHNVVDISLRTDGQSRFGTETAYFVMQIEASSVDSFISQIDKMKIEPAFTIWDQLFSVSG